MSFASSREAQAAHWFSRRHRTLESHNEAIEAKPYSGGRKNRQRRAQERAAK